MTFFRNYKLSSICWGIYYMYVPAPSSEEDCKIKYEIYPTLSSTHMTWNPTENS
jgi:hypothetical protein